MPSTGGLVDHRNHFLYHAFEAESTGSNRQHGSLTRRTARERLFKNSLPIRADCAFALYVGAVGGTKPFATTVTKMNASIIARAILTTGALSSLTVWHSIRGSLTHERGDEIIREWSRRLLNQVDMRLTVRGFDNVDPMQTYVVMSNHQSLYDIPTLITALPLRLRMVAKSELFKVPIWSRAMKSTGFVPVHRGQRDKAMQDLRVAQAALAQGINIWIAPEGTRSRDGQLLPFKSGGFLLASAAKVPILPVTIDGTRAILPAKALHFVKGVQVKVTMGKPISATSYSRKDRNQFIDAVRASILAGFDSNQGPAEST